MTAVVGILNSHGIAIAADSAVTVSGLNNRKVHNYANKIFTLSKHHPVGVAIYNNAAFMGIPWEVLIKEYRRQLGGEFFATLGDYKKGFFAWLKSNNFFLENDPNELLQRDFFQFTSIILKEFFKKIKGLPGIDLSGFLEDYINVEIPNHELNVNLSEIDPDKVKALLGKFVSGIAEAVNKSSGKRIISESAYNPLVEAYFSYLKHDQFTQFSGLIFFGYGDTEIFPEILPVNVSSVIVDGHLRYMEDKRQAFKISARSNACIAPFAQTDVINTILKGMSPEVFGLSQSVLSAFLNDLLKKVIPSIPSLPESIKTQLSNIPVDELAKKYQLNLENIINEKYVYPLMNTVAQLSKEDLAEMAESLVYLTYLKRRFTMAEESVGGPVDVAIITKGDGFIWIKRKHYFDPKLNQNFFQKYFYL